jgi:hypothetical protein
MLKATLINESSRMVWIQGILAELRAGVARPVRPTAMLTTCALLAACAAGVENRRDSVPYIDGVAATEAPHHWPCASRLISAGDIDFCIEPQNGRAADVLALPIPMLTKEQVDPAPYIVQKGGADPEHTFQAGVWFCPKRSGFLFEPSGVRLSLAPVNAIAPSMVFAYFEESSSDNGAKVQLLATVRHPDISEPVLLKAGICSMFLFQFAVPPPDPKTEFEITIVGVRSGDTPYQLPSVTFREKKSTHSLTGSINR